MIFDNSWAVRATSSFASSVGHQGLYHDPETGLIHNRARYRHPTLGRWVGRDPLGYVDGMSVYESHGSAPTLYVDPWGLTAEQWWNPYTWSYDETDARNSRNRQGGSGHHQNLRGGSNQHPSMRPFPAERSVNQQTLQQQTHAANLAAQTADQALAATETGVEIAMMALPDPMDAAVAAALATKGWRYCKALGKWLNKSDEVVPDADVAKVLDALKRARPWSGKPTAKQAREEAARRGWKEVPGMGRSHDQAIFTDGKKYYSADEYGHRGGTWKLLDRNGNRIGTLDRELNQIAE